MPQNNFTLREEVILMDIVSSLTDYLNSNEFVNMPVFNFGLIDRDYLLEPPYVSLEIERIDYETAPQRALLNICIYVKNNNPSIRYGELMRAQIQLVRALSTLNPRLVSGGQFPERLRQVAVLHFETLDNDPDMDVINGVIYCVVVYSEDMHGPGRIRTRIAGNQLT